MMKKQLVLLFVICAFTIKIDASSAINPISFPISIEEELAPAVVARHDVIRTALQQPFRTTNLLDQYQRARQENIFNATNFIDLETLCSTIEYDYHILFSHMTLLSNHIMGTLENRKNFITTTLQHHILQGDSGIPIMHLHSELYIIIDMINNEVNMNMEANLMMDLMKDYFKYIYNMINYFNDKKFLRLDHPFAESALTSEEKKGIRFIDIIENAKLPCREDNQNPVIPPHENTYTLKVSWPLASGFISGTDPVYRFFAPHDPNYKERMRQLTTRLFEVLSLINQPVKSVHPNECRTQLIRTRAQLSGKTALIESYLQYCQDLNIYRSKKKRILNEYFIGSLASLMRFFGG